MLQLSYDSATNVNVFTAERQAFARRARASEEVMRERMMDAKTMVQEEKLSKREITYGKHSA